jgi:transcription antitermination factor NusG
LIAEKLKIEGIYTVYDGSKPYSLSNEEMEELFNRKEEASSDLAIGDEVLILPSTVLKMFAGKTGKIQHILDADKIDLQIAVGHGFVNVKLNTGDVQKIG